MPKFVNLCIKISETLARFLEVFFYASHNLYANNENIVILR